MPSFLALLIAGVFFTGRAFADLLPFPLSANQRGTVTCLENPSVSYDIYLPLAYTTNGTPLPILYTLHPNKGGMVSSFQGVCSSLNIITVGITGSGNSVPWDTVLREFYAVTRDIRQRVLFDPTAELVGGFSGGGENSYVFSRFHAQHVAGVFMMAGWLGRGGGYPTYQTTDRVQTNLLVARARGLSDGGGWVMVPDSNYLASCGAIIQDWYFSGGHVVPPDSVKSNCLSWLLSRRIPAGPYDQSNALAQASDWRSRAAAGQTESVLRECVATLMNQPRTWNALEAQLVMDDLMAYYESFRGLNVSDLAQGDFASDLFYYYGRGAALNNDLPRYHASLKALTGITGTNGDRAGDIYALLLQKSYPIPILQISADQTLGQINLWLSKDTPGLTYTMQSRSDFVNDIWQDTWVAALDTNTTWSTAFGFDPGATSGFYCVRTAPLPATSPPWPPP